MFEGIRRERLVHRTLRTLSKQRVVDILQPGGVWLLERALMHEDPGVAASLRTCHLRGWVEIVEDAVPHGSIDANANINYPEGTAPVYRLTEAGWAALNRTHEWVIRTFIVAAAALVVALLAWVVP